MTPNDPPCIAHVLHRLYLAGAEVLAADLSRRLRDRYRFVFLCLDETGPLGEQLRGEGFEVVNLQRRPGFDRSVARRLHQACRTHDIRLLHAHQYAPFFYSALSRGLMGTIRARPPILFTEHGRHYPDTRRPKRVLANRVLLREQDRVTAVGHFIRQMLIENEGMPGDRIEVIHNGIDPETFARGADWLAVRQQVREELDLAAEAPVVLQVARLHPVKDHATAVRAMALVARQCRDAMLVLVGDGELRQQVQSLVQSLGLAHNVRFLGVRSDVPRLMAAADVFVLSSLSEGISVTLLEAMGCELPIAATDVGGNGEVVEHGTTGLLSPRQDHEALGRNLLTLLTDAQAARAMGAAGRQRLLARFTQRQMHDGYAGYYARMLAPGKRV